MWVREKGQLGAKVVRGVVWFGWGSVCGERGGVVVADTTTIWRSLAGRGSSSTRACVRVCVLACVHVCVRVCA